MNSVPQSATTVHVSALPTGRIHLPDRWIFEDGDEDMHHARQLSPDFSFLISHPSGKHVLFDLGMRKDFEGNPDVIRADKPYISPIVPHDSVDLLKQGLIQPQQISSVIFSHLHFDHVGDPTKFSHAEFVTGPGSLEATTPGWPRSSASPFLSAIIEHDKYHELSFETDEWVNVGVLGRGYDFFGDSSFYLVDTPGHMAGHLSGFAHVGSGQWVFMGGDCCHHRALLEGKRPMSITIGPNGTSSFHKDPTTAMSTIQRVRVLEKGEDVFVVLAHDAFLEGLMPLYPAHLNGWKGSSWKHKLDTAVIAAFRG